MKREEAIALLDQTLGNAFDESQFRRLVLNLVNDLDESKSLTQQGQYIKESFRDQVRQYKRIGQYTDPDECVVDVLVVRLHKSTSLDRARTMQRNFIAKYLQDRDEKEAALVAYYHDESEDWRFSFVRVDYQIVEIEGGKFKPQKEITAARRSSFLVGKNEPNHTARKQLLDLLLEDRKNPTLEQLEELFQIESVTKEFFEKYKERFLELKEELEELVKRDPVIAQNFEAHDIDIANFAKKLLGQIVFLYFLQKKGWLGVSPEQGWGNGAKNYLRRLFSQEIVPYQNFFNDLLEPLFYEALAVERGQNSIYEPLKCKIPFLNGGLFEPIGGYDWRKTDILIPNETFAKILDTFDLYNFTVREDEPLEKEVAVDPEMLGKVFENLLEVTDRKSKGAFYTPREIVHYMCQESLINYLDTTVNTQTVEIIPKAGKQETLFGETEPSQLPLTKQEYCERVPRGDLEILIRQGEQFVENDEQSLEKEQKIAKQELASTVYQFQVPEKVRQFASEIDQALAEVKICDPAIGSGAFPVGIMQEIVKVRGVLNTYLPEEDRRTAYDFKRHAIQASIYGVDIDSGAVDIAKLRLWLSLVVDEEDFESIKPLPNLDYKIVCGNSLLRVEKNIFNHQSFAELEHLKQDYLDETNAANKTELKKSIQKLIQTITNDDETFDFEVYFSEVIHQNRGFDVVIGNPPYVRMEQIKHLKEELKVSFNCFTGRADLYVYFYELGINLLNKSGNLAYISSNKFFRSAYGKKLRQLLSTKTQLRIIIDFGDEKVFEAIAYPTVVILKKAESQKRALKALVWNKKHSIKDFVEVIESDSFFMPQSSLASNGWQFIDEDSLRLLKKLRSRGTPLGEYVDGCFYRGIVTGLNEAFVVDQVTRDKLVTEDSSSAEIIKPFIRGRDVKRWGVNYQQLWLIFTRRGIDIDSYPAIKKYLAGFKEQLLKRATSHTHPWYELQQPQEGCWQEFEKPKIFIPAIADGAEYALDYSNFYGNDKTNICISEDIEFLIAILNSSIMWWFIQQIAASRQGGFYEFKAMYVTQIPIPQASQKEKDSLKALVKECLAKAKDISGIEQQIENIVGQLFDLTPDDWAIIKRRDH